MGVKQYTRPTRLGGHRNGVGLRPLRTRRVRRGQVPPSIHGKEAGEDPPHL